MTSVRWIRSMHGPRSSRRGSVCGVLPARNAASQTAPDEAQDDRHDRNDLSSPRSRRWRSRVAAQLKPERTCPYQNGLGPPKF